MKKFFLHEPKIGSYEKKEVLKCLNTGWISPGGENVRKFEKEISKLTNLKSILTNSGTSALHLSLILAGLKSEEEVVVPSITFIATINVVLYLGGKPIFFDNNEDNLNIDIKKIFKFLRENTYTTNIGTFNRKTKKRIRAIIVTHVFGNIIDLKELKNFLRNKKIKLIEDAAEAVGSFNLEGEHAGSFGDYGILSFNINKVITTASGGALLVKSDKDYKRAKLLISQGKLNNIFFTHQEMGFNYGMTNINASIGLGQFKILKKIIYKKKKIYEKYLEIFKGNKDIKILKFRNDTKPNYWMNSIFVKKLNYEKLKKIIKKINNLGIEVRPLWYPCHKQNFLKKFEKFRIQNSESYFKKVICLPSSFFLREREIVYISNTIENVIKKEIR